MRTTVYVRLLDEGTHAYRPVNARLIERNIYRLENTTIPPEEVWEFEPGMAVIVEERNLENENVLVAIQKSVDI